MVLRLAGVVLLTCLAFSEAPAQGGHCSASVHIRTVEVPGPQPGVRKTLRILTPPGYHDRSNRMRRYPVLYLLDGQELFDPCTAEFEPLEWGVDETVTRMINAREIEPIIVVGIDHAGKHLRPHEYLPYPDDSLRPFDPNPQGRLYPTFLARQVIPFVDRHYRTRPAPAGRAIGGSSYGAGMALYSAAKLKGRFGAVIAESPSVYASDYRLFSDLRAASWRSMRIYLGTGTTVQEPTEDVEKLKSLFHSLGVQPSNLRLVVQQGATHSARWWRERLPTALRFLFGTTSKS